MAGNTPQDPEATRDELVRVPARFYDDHTSRFDYGAGEHPPEPVRNGRRHVWLRRDDPQLPLFVADARYYHDARWGFDPQVQRTICRSAKATLDALERQGVDVRP